ncbi:hypothetical protein ScPMuIL_010262 [Solemya velum]
MGGWLVRRRSIGISPHSTCRSLMEVKRSTPRHLRNLFGIIIDNTNKSKEILSALELALQVADDYNDDHSQISIEKIVNYTDVSDGYALSDLMCWQVEQMVFAIFGVSHSVTYNVLQSYSQSLQIPWITANPARSSAFEQYSFQLSLCPTFVDAVADFIKYFQWKKIYYLFDSDDGLWRLQHLFEAFRPPSRTLAVDARRIKNPWDVYDILRQLDRSDPYFERRIVLDLSSKEAYNAVMAQVIDVGMNRDGYHYILGLLSITELDLNVFQHGGVNITGFQLIDESSDLVQSFYRKWRYSIGKDRIDSSISPSVKAALTIDGIAVLTYALKTIWDNKRLRKMVYRTRRGKLFNTNESGGLDCPVNTSGAISEWKHNNRRNEKCKSILASIHGVSGYLHFDKYGQRDGYKLDVYQLQYKTELRKVGVWSKQGFKTKLVAPNDAASGRMFDSNVTWRITTIMEAPYVMEKKNNEDGHPLPQHEGYIIDLAKKVSDIVNFKYHFHLVKDGKYGARVNGTWNGMIGELINNDADIAMAPLTITKIREIVVDFTKPFQKTAISIMIKKPEKQKPGVFSFKEPLSDYVWLCVIIGFLQSASGRIAGSAWWFFTLILISSYTANLAAFLTVEKLITSIDSVDDLVGQTSVRYGILNSGSSYSFFNSSRVVVYEKMFQFMTNAVPSVFVNSNEEGWRRVITEKGKYAYLLESAFNEYFNQKRPCHTMTVGEDFDHKGYGIATKPNFALTARLNLAVLQLREIGELIKLEQRWWYDKGECGTLDSTDHSQRALTLSNVSGIFHILIAGLLMAMVVALFEYLIKRRVRGSSKKYQINSNSGSASVEKSIHDPTKSEQNPKNDQQYRGSWRTYNNIVCDLPLDGKAEQRLKEKVYAITPNMLSPILYSSLVVDSTSKCLNVGVKILGPLRPPLRTLTFKLKAVLHRGCRRMKDQETE